LTKRIERRTRYVSNRRGPPKRVCINSAPQQRGMQRACVRKVRFDSERVARREAERCTEQSGRPFHTYRCRYCDAWHLSSRDASLAKEIALLELHLGMREPR
jgi:hypothetical protein